MKDEIEILNHNLVPNHILLDEQEIKNLLSKYNISLNQLPKIVRNDPAVKKLTLKSGDVVKIIRTSGTAGESFYYRVVISIKIIS